MIRAAGAIFLSKTTKRLLLNFRSGNVPKPLTFGFWGGKIIQNENLNEGLTRELFEEIGFIPDFIKCIPVDIFLSPDGKFIYYSFVILVEKEFIPNINSESAGYMWCDIGKYPKFLHHGAKIILFNKSVKEELFKLIN